MDRDTVLTAFLFFLSINHFIEEKIVITLKFIHSYLRTFIFTIYFVDQSFGRIMMS